MAAAELPNAGGEIPVRDVGYYWNVDLRAAFETNGRPEEHLDCGRSAMASRSRPSCCGVDLRLRSSRGMTCSTSAGLLRVLAYLDLASDT